MMKLTSLLQTYGIKIDSIVGTKEDALDRLLTLQSAMGGVSDPALLKADILAREHQGSTALAGGVAVPHAKSRGVTKLGVTVLTAPKGIDFGAPDGKPSNLIFLIAGPENAPDSYLEALSALMTLLLDKSLAGKLTAAKNQAEFMALLTAAEG